MIVVIGGVVALGSGADAVPGGAAAGIALSAAAAGARVEVVARIGDDPAGDAVLIGFGAAGVGHVATLRDPARSTPTYQLDDGATDLDADVSPAGDVHPRAPGTDHTPILDHGDVGLALRYLSDYRVIVAVQITDPAVLAETIAAAGWAGAHLVVVTTPDDPEPQGLPAGSLVLAAPDDAAGLGDLLGRYAAAVDGGEDPITAFAAVSAAAAPVGD